MYDDGLNRHELVNEYFGFFAGVNTYAAVGVTDAVSLGDRNSDATKLAIQNLDSGYQTVGTIQERVLVSACLYGNKPVFSDYVEPVPQY